MSKLFKDIATYGAADFFAKGMGLVYAPILTRLLTPVQYGAGPLLLAVWAPLVTILYGGADWSYPYLKADDRTGERNLQLVTTASFISFISVIIVWSGFALFAFTGWMQTYAKVSNTALALFLLMLAPMALTTWFLNPLRYMKQAGPYVRVSLIGQVLPVLVAMPFLLLVAQPERLSVLWGAGFIIQLFALGWALREMSRCGVWPFSISNFSAPLARKMFRFGIVLVPAAFLYTFTNVVDRLLVGWLLGPEQVAFLQLAIALGAISTMLAGWFSLAFDPHVIEWVATKDAKIYEPKLQLSLKLLTVLFFGLACAVALWSGWIIRLLFPPEYIMTAQLLPAITLCTAFNTVSRIGLTTVIIAQSPRYRLFVNLAALLVNIAVGIIAIPHFGVIGAIIGTLMAELFMLFCWIVIGKFKLSNLNLNWRMTLLTGLGCSVFVLFYSPQNMWTSKGLIEAVILTIILLAASYSLLRVSVGKVAFAGLSKEVFGMFTKKF